jgi:hypothetical protein
MRKNLSETVERKFIESFDIDDWEIDTDTGWQDISQIHKTIEYEEWLLETASGLSLVCADTHIVFNENYEEVFVKDLVVNESLIITRSGFDVVTKLEKLNTSSHMYDVTVNSNDHRFWSNDILSHNSVTTIAFILWSILFNDDYVVAILANKGSLAREQLGRLQKAYEYLPKWLQQGIITWNKGNIELENGSKVFSYATSAAGVRGGSFNCISGDSSIVIMDDYDRIFIDNIENAANKEYIYDMKRNFWENNYLFYTVYKIQNLVNNKEYIGYHHTNDLNDNYMGSGTLIQKAIEKYGIENFSKEYIEIFDNRDDAVALEAYLVNEEYVKLNTNYNLALGGFSGPGNKSKDDDIIIDGERYFSYNHAKISLNIRFSELNKLLMKEGNGFINKDFHKAFIEKIKDLNDRTLKRNNYLSSLWKGVKKSEDHINKINKNPEKIKKTSDKHRGMKRSKETREKMSLAKRGKIPHNMGKKYCYNPETLDKKLCYIHEIPEGWVLGFIPKRK